MRGGCCAGFGIVFSVAAVVLLGIGSVSQIDSSTIPRNLRIVTINTADLGEALAAVTKTENSAEFKDLYNNDFTNSYRVQSNGTHDGLRINYEWGFWGYCATNDGVGSLPSYCTPMSLGNRFTPASYLAADVPQQFTETYMKVIPSNVFQADDYLGNYTSAASYLIFVGCILSGLALLFGLFAHRITFLLCAIFALVGSVALGVGLIVYTIIFQRVISALSAVKIQGAPAGLGIEMEMGSGLWIMWAGAIAMFFAILPYSIACCVGRKQRKGRSHDHSNLKEAYQY